MLDEVLIDAGNDRTHWRRVGFTGLHLASALL